LVRAAACAQRHLIEIGADCTDTAWARPRAGPWGRVVNVKAAIRRLTRSSSWEVRRLDPDLTLDTYLWFMLPHFGVNTVLDVGAHVGEFGELLRNNDYRGQIISFEPVGSSYTALQSACSHDPVWTAHNCALGATETVTTMNITRGTNFASFRSGNKDAHESFPDIEVVGTETVTVRRLDRLFDELVAGIREPRIYLKIDTQGWDREVLEGATGCLDKIVGLQTEVSLAPLYEDTPMFEEMIGECRRAGFEVTALFPVARLGGWRLAELDCVMLRRELC
jgi:FkbM family methyltransferase